MKFSEKLKNYKNKKYIKSVNIIYNLTHKYEDAKQYNQMEVTKSKNSTILYSH